MLPAAPASRDSRGILGAPGLGDEADASRMLDHHPLPPLRERACEAGRVAYVLGWASVPQYVVYTWHRRRYSPATASRARIQGPHPGPASRARIQGPHPGPASRARIQGGALRMIEGAEPDVGDGTRPARVRHASGASVHLHRREQVVLLACRAPTAIEAGAD
jgi:hypothetical protein